MRRSSLKLVLVLLAFVGVTSAQDEIADVQFLVLKDDNNKPVRNASVIMHPVRKDGKQSRGGLQLKTNAEGAASYDSVPYGKLRIQVLARGFQTYGEDFEVDKPSMKITVRLKRPQDQYSIYEEHPGDPKPDVQKDKDDDKAPPADGESKPK